MTPPLTFTWALDAAEQVRVSTLVARRTPGGRLWRRLGIPLLALPLVLALVLGWPLTLLTPYAIILGLCAAIALAVPAIQRWQTRRALAAAGPLGGPITYHLAEDAIVLKTGVSATRLSWDAVEEVEETPDMFVLHFAGRFAYYLPKRVTGADSAAVRHLLRAQLGPRAHGVRGDATPSVT